MAIFKFIRRSSPKSFKRPNLALEAAIHAQRRRLFEARAMTLSVLEGLRGFENADPRVADTIGSIGELICDVVLALDPVRLGHMTTTAANTRWV